MKSKWITLVTVLTALFVTGEAMAVKLQSSLFEREHSRIMYETGFQALGEDSGFFADEGFSATATGSTEKSGMKSPGRAFFYSLVVPGLGQYYCGSKIKPLLFLSAEVTSWVFYFKFHGQGDDLTAEYEAFNDAHWYRQRYEDYLLFAYDTTDDRGIKGFTEHLPDEKSQQYYEMTGKYDQFAWGWDDAVLRDSTLYDYDTLNKPPTIDQDVPTSARRESYENMRDDANNKYDRATRMVFVSLANRIVSAFEAYFTAKRRNNKVERATWDLSRLNVRTRLKSYHSYGDTPFMTFSYKF